VSLKNESQRLTEIEQSQAILREQIEDSKRLLDRSHQLIQYHRDQTRPASPEPQV
jgi:hypothetical protein